MSERVPEPLEMSDTEIVEWMGEHCDSARWIEDKWYVSSYSWPAVAKVNFRNAVCLAAAYHKEANA